LTVRQALIEHANKWLAGEIWRKISTELEDNSIQGRFPSEAEKYNWLMARIDTLLKEHVPRKKGKDEKETEN